MNYLLNRIVRAWLWHSPITGGRSKILRATRPYIRPHAPNQVSATKCGFSLRLNLDNPEHERIYFYGEHDERDEIACLRKLIVPGMICWDIGANIGFYTCLLSMLVGADGKVVSFEPATTTRQMLEGNVQLNRMNNVEIVPLALGARDTGGHLYFGASELAEGTASIYPGHGRSQSEPVLLARLDTIADRYPVPEFVKIDVEGAQEDVWAGGETFFGQTEALVMAELRESSEPSNHRKLLSRVRAHQFRIFEMNKGGCAREIDDFSASRKRNFLLAKTKTEAAKRVEALIA